MMMRIMKWLKTYTECQHNQYFKQRELQTLLGSEKRRKRTRRNSKKVMKEEEGTGQIVTFSESDV